MTQGNQSEVARLKAQIDAETMSAELAMHGFAVVAKHEAITTHMENMGVYHEQLRGIVGDKEATEILIASLERLPSQEIGWKPGNA